jgi:hypothetical protein
LQILPPGGAKPAPSAGASRQKPKIVGEPTPPRVAEHGGTLLLAERRATNTLFVALHEPFEKGKWRIEEFRRIGQTDDAVAVAIRGPDVNDRVMIRQGRDADKDLALGDGRERFVFKGFAYVRIAPDKVTAAGDLLEMELDVQGAPAFELNGKSAKAEAKGGKLTFRR